MKCLIAPENPAAVVIHIDDNPVEGFVEGSHNVSFSIIRYMAQAYQRVVGVDVFTGTRIERHAKATERILGLQATVDDTLYISDRLPVVKIQEP